jgi:molybdate transport system substrate-binding protein
MKALITIGVQSVIEALEPKLEQASGHALEITFGLGPVLAERVRTGEAADFLILPRAAVDSLIMTGKVAPGSYTVLASNVVAVGVRKGASKPDISTPDALRRALLAARAISYGNPAYGGPASIHFAKVLKRLGIAEEVKAKTKFPSPGGFVGNLLVKGEVDIGVQQLSELLSVSGTDVIGPLPGDLHNVTVYAAVIPIGSTAPDGA